MIKLYAIYRDGMFLFYESCLDEYVWVTKLSRDCFFDFEENALRQAKKYAEATVRTYIITEEQFLPALALVA